MAVLAQWYVHPFLQGKGFFLTKDFDSLGKVKKTLIVLTNDSDSLEKVKKTFRVLTKDFDSLGKISRLGDSNESLRTEDVAAPEPSPQPKPSAPVSDLPFPHDSSVGTLALDLNEHAMDQDH
ncbi:hypothetical protein JHK84_043727 [Glycine max]|nr:hypothetical protein JHK84_043727 [Glycine max]